jgi:type IV pilus assembly protein PilB
MGKTSKRIGEILIEKGLLSEKQLAEALQEQKTSSGFLGTILINKGWISQKNFLGVLAEQFGLQLVDMRQENIDMELARSFPASLILQQKCFPLRQDDESITVAIINPLNAAAISQIDQAVKPRRVNLVLASEEDIDTAIQDYRRYVSQGIQRLLKKDKQT